MKLKISAKEILKNIFSRPVFQSLFEQILNLSLKILNIGEGQSVETSGESSVFKILNRLHKENAVIFDIGAHTGEWFQLCKKYYSKKSTVYSFEPSKESFTQLSQIKEVGFHPENMAFGETSGKGFLSGDTNGSSGASITKAQSGVVHSEEIDITTIDQYCSEHHIDHIDLLKLDIEGYELKALAGAKKMLKNGSIGLIQFEFGAPSEEKYTLKDFFDLLGHQYTICRILKHGYYPLKKYRHYYEILTVTNFIAIKK